MHDCWLLTERSKQLQKDCRQALIKSFWSFLLLARCKNPLIEILLTVWYHTKVSHSMVSRSGKIRTINDSSEIIGNIWKETQQKTHFQTEHLIQINKEIWYWYWIWYWKFDLISEKKLQVKLGSYKSWVIYIY